MTDTAPEFSGKPEPAEPGWYSYSGGTQVMIFHLRDVSAEYAGPLASHGNTRQWSVHLDNGTASDCAWGYIEQALSVWDLVKITADPSPITFIQNIFSPGELDGAEIYRQTKDLLERNRG